MHDLKIAHELKPLAADLWYCTRLAHPLQEGIPAQRNPVSLIRHKSILDDLEGKEALASRPARAIKRIRAEMDLPDNYEKGVLPLALKA